jgi:hypothetical protein
MDAIATRPAVQRGRNSPPRAEDDAVRIEKARSILV